MTLPSIVVASSNPHKRVEIDAYLAASGLTVHLVSLPQDYVAPDEDGETFLDNAILKAKAAVGLYKNHWVLAEDSGFVVPALAGTAGLDPFPGVRSNRWLTATTSNNSGDTTYAELNQGILNLMAEKSQASEGQAEDRRAYFVCAMVLCDAEGQLRFQTEGRLPLTLIDSHEPPTGTQGFGYDPIVRPTALLQRDDRRTIAELSTAEKNEISHRGQALTALVHFLKTDLNTNLNTTILGQYP